MKKIIIQGGRPLNGTVRISGSKNAALPCLFATLLTDETCLLENVPDLEDISTTCGLLEFLGKKIERKGHSITVSHGRKPRTEAPYDLVRRMRASVLVLGPLLARYGHAAASLPGGCAIGNRPIDIHLSGFERLGAKSQVRQGMVRLEGARLEGGEIKFHFPSVGATENILMAAVLSPGTTWIRNAAREPEIVDLADFLNRMGADVRGAGTSAIKVAGKSALRGARHWVIPDRIETATYLIAAAATKGTLVLEGTRSSHLNEVIRMLRKAGARIQTQLRAGKETIICSGRKAVRPVSVSTGIYPKFPTDVQAQWMALMAVAQGRSTIQETIFENRFLHAAELRRMGAQIEIKGNRATVTGSKELSGANVMVSDLRAGAAMIIAGLIAKGTTVVHRIYHLDRGYEELEKKLRKAGARIRRVQ